MAVYVDSKEIYHASKSSFSFTKTLNPGKHKTKIKAWDHCGGTASVTRTIQVTSQIGVNTATPLNNSLVSSPVNFVSTGTTDCADGIAGMGIYVNNELVYGSNGPNLNTQLTLAAGVQNASIEEWDNCGGSNATPVEFVVTGSQGVGTVLPNIQAASGWNNWAEFPPTYAICSSNCTGITWSMQQGIAPPLPSLSGNATQFNIAGTTAYADVLWSNPLLGQFSTQGYPDKNHVLLPTLHNFTYDADFFVTNLPVTQVLEFDISMYMGPVGMIWGTQCNNLGGGAGGAVWDIWDNVNAHWLSTGVPCALNNNAWNHITIQAQREPDNTLLYESISLNGNTAILNSTYPPFTVPQSWWGITVNYQMDGNHTTAANTTYVDNLTFTYW